jgi:hypothetical protein
MALETIGASRLNYKKLKLSKWGCIRVPFAQMQVNGLYFLHIVKVSFLYFVIIEK